MTMTYLCVIPARGGSKGVPRKNVRAVAGKPLIQWTIEHALATPGHLRVVVSTDDDEIAAVAQAAGAEVPFLRPAELALDHTSTEPVVLHALTELARDGYHPDAVILLQATSPVRRPDTIARAIAQFEREDVDSLVGVVPQAPFLWRLSDPPVPAYDVEHRPLRQDIPAADHFFREIGSLYVTRTAIYEGNANRLGGRISLFVMDEVEGIDIDTEGDLRLAELQLSDMALASERPSP